MNLLQHIAQSRHLLRKSELKVADHVLLDPAAVMHSSMADLAHSVGISEPTIVRFCRAIGCSGFQDLKLKLAQSLAAGASFGQFAIHEDDSVADYSLKIFDTTLHTLMEVREKLDPIELQKAVTAMSQAQRVEFYGFGASGAVAADAQHKFFRLLLTAAAYSDPHMQAMSAVTLKPTDVAICISQSGRSKDLLITANLVRESGATLITLCPSQTPLAELSTVNLAIDVHEDTEIYTPLTSRIAHLVVIDVLAMGVAMARGPSLVNHLKSVKRSLQARSHILISCISSRFIVLSSPRRQTVTARAHPELPYSHWETRNGPSLRRQQQRRKNPPSAGRPTPHGVPSCNRRPL